MHLLEGFLRSKLINLTLGCLLLILLPVSSNASKLKVLFKTESEFGPIWVFDDNNLRCISCKPVADVLQTCKDLHNPDKLVFSYFRSIMGSLYINNNPKTILILGTGGGALPMTFAKILPQAQIDAVEINQAMVDIAKRFFGFKEGNNLKLTVQDGVEFIKDKHNLYDIIILDAFDSEYIPDKILSEEFFTNVRNALTENGIVVANIFIKSKYTQKENDLFNKVFSHRIDLISGGNKIIILSNNNFPSLKTIKENAKALKEHFVNLGVDTDQLIGKFPR